MRALSPLAFLLIAIALSVIGSVALWLRTRPPRSLSWGIEEFRSEMQALAPGARPSAGRRSRGRGARGGNAGS